jgi:hypothetical protein
MTSKEDKRQTQNILNALEKQTIEKQAQTDFDFRLQVLIGIAEVKKEVSILSKTVSDNDENLFDRVASLEKNGCGKAPIHEDHEIRIRGLEKAPPPAQPIPAFQVPDSQHTEPVKKFGLGKLMKWENFGAGEILVMIIGIALIATVISVHLGSRRLSRLEEFLVKMNGGTVTNNVTGIVKGP